VTRKWLMTLDTYANATYGRSVSSAVIAGTCVSCGGSAYPFATDEAATMYPQVGLCQGCQNAQRSIADTIVPFNQNYRTENV
jgi:hypothetical protein